jgi:metallo-beta-lactamase class B
MRSMLGYACAAGFLLAAASLPAQEISPGLSVARLGDGVYVVTHAYPWPSNSLVAAMRDGRLLMVDTPYTPEATEELLTWAKRKFGAASLASLSSLIAYPAIRAYFRSFRYVAPTRTFDPRLGLVLDFGGEEIRVEYPGVGHSVDNLVVYLPDKRLVFSGCMILSLDATGIGNAADGEPAQWLASVGRIRTLGYDHIVPGHGRPGGVELVARSADLLRESLK